MQSYKRFCSSGSVIVGLPLQTWVEERSLESCKFHQDLPGGCGSVIYIRVICCLAADPSDNSPGMRGAPPSCMGALPDYASGTHQIYLRIRGVWCEKQCRGRRRSVGKRGLTIILKTRVECYCQLLIK